MFSKIKKGGLAVLAGLGLGVGSAVAAVPTAISDMVTDATTVWGTVETLILAIVAFSILIGIVKLVRRR